MVSKLFSRTRSKGSPIEAFIEVERYRDGVHNYRASPVRMAIRGKEVSFQFEDFIAYGWTRRGPGKRCLAKVVSFLKEEVKTHEE